MGIFNIFAKPLGWLMSVMYGWFGSYFLTIFLFTLLVRVLMFPLRLHQQKTQADRARLAPRLERLQKKYAKDQKKMMEKQQELFEKEGVKMTAGCLPMLITMLVLFSVIAVIYKPLSFLHNVPEAAVNASVTALTEIKDEDGKEVINKKELSGYYAELGILSYASQYPNEIKAALTEAKIDDVETVYEKMLTVKEEFSFFGMSFLDRPWNGTVNWLWLVAILSGLTAFGTSIISMHYTKATMAQQQPGQGCSTNAMMYTMPIFSLVISFTVPAGVGLYWIFSNLLAMVETVIVNLIYNPAKIRAQAEIEYEERRRRKREDKERLKEARLREQAAWQKAENEAAQKKKNPVKPTAAKSPAAETDGDGENPTTAETDENGKE